MPPTDAPTPEEVAAAAAAVAAGTGGTGTGAGATAKTADAAAQATAAGDRDPESRDAPGVPDKAGPTPPTGAGQMQPPPANGFRKAKKDEKTVKLDVAAHARVDGKDYLVPPKTPFPCAADEADSLVARFGGEN